MKTLSLNVVALAVLLASSMACKKQPAYLPSPSGGSLTLNGESYALSNGYLENLGLDSTYSGTYFDLFLMSDGVNRITKDGTGQIVYFEMFSSNTADLASGLYRYSKTNDTATFEAARITDYENSAIAGFRYNVLGGEMAVSKEGNRYTFSGTFQCYDFYNLDSATAELHYSGMLYKD